MRARWARWARLLLCPASWHDWQFVLVTERGHVWAMKRCQRCEIQTLGTPMDRDTRGSTC